VFYMTALLLAFLAAVLVVVCIVAIIFRMRERGMPFAGTRSSQNDLTNTMIMFQTMRDILEQQKDLARQLNVSLDKKVQYIRNVVDSALGALREMHETVHALAAELAAAKAELAALRAREGSAAGDAVAGEEQEGAAQPAVQHAVPAPLASFETLAQLLPDEPAANPPDTWAGLDSGEMAEEPEPVSAPPETPETMEATRSAFRALLNLDKSGAETKPDAEDSGGAGGNGRTNTTPLKRRIYEYSDVGMSVSEIARELGLGKGEVRLILNLRKDRGE
jgi:AcrR family transcriptional regulator